MQTLIEDLLTDGNYRRTRTGITSGQGELILVVDDEATIRDVIKTSL